VKRWVPLVSILRPGKARISPYEFTRTKISQIEKPPAALAGGGLGAALQQVPFDQASLPAHELEPLIRHAANARKLGMSRQQPNMARKICMTLSQVEQSGEGRVKNLTPDRQRSMRLQRAGRPSATCARDARCVESAGAYRDHPPDRTQR